MRKLLPVLFTLLLATALGCSHDEPSGHGHSRPGSDTTGVHTDTTDSGRVTPPDTVRPPDTTAADTGGSSTPPLSISAPATEAYAGQTLQLTALHARGAVNWRSTTPRVLTVDDNGLVTFANTQSDTSATVIATDSHGEARLELFNRCWKVVLWQNGAWVGGYDTYTVTPGDTVTATVAGSDNLPINRCGFNAAACQWHAQSYTATSGQILASGLPPNADNGYRASFVIGQVPSGTLFYLCATLGNVMSYRTLLVFY